MSAEEDLLLDVRHLCVRFGDAVVVDDVSFQLRRGECLGLVGGSGSGKSVTSLALMGLLDGAHAQVTGQALLRTDQGTVDLLALSDEALRAYAATNWPWCSRSP